MGALALLFLYCQHLMPDTTTTASCMVDLKWCAIEAATEYPDRTFEERVDNCSETIAFRGVERWVKYQR